MNYGGLITLNGQNDLALAALSGPPLTFTHVAVGDGGGVEYAPVENQTALANERGRYPVTSVAVQPDGRMVVAATIPANAGGWNIREAGIITSDGRLFLIANYPVTFKPAAGSGGSLDLTIVLVVDIGNTTTSAINVTVQSSAKVALSRHGRAPFIAVDGLVSAPPTNPTEGLLVAVGGFPLPTGVFAGRGGQLGEYIDNVWTFANVAITTLVRLPDGSFRERVASNTALELWVVWLVDQNHTHTSAQITDFSTGIVAVGDTRYLRKDQSDTVTAAGATHEFQHLTIGPSPFVGTSRALSLRGLGDAFPATELRRATGHFNINVRDPVTYAVGETALSVSDVGVVTARGSVARFRANEPGNAAFTDFLSVGAAAYIGNPSGVSLLTLKHDGSSQLMRRAGVDRQIATENRVVATGAGLLGGGDLSADRTLSVDPAWIEGESSLKQQRRAQTNVNFVVSHISNIYDQGGPPPNSAAGVELCSMVFTPKNAASMLNFRMSGTVATGSSLGTVTLALFEDGVANPVCLLSAIPDVGSVATVFAESQKSALSTAARTYRLKAYAASSQSEILINRWYLANSSTAYTTGFTVTETR